MQKATFPQLLSLSFRILTFLATQSLLEIELNAQRWDVLDIGGKDLFPIGISDNKEILARGIKPNSFGAHAQTWLWLPESKNGLPQGWNEIGTSFEFSVEPESISSNGIVAGRYGLISNGVLKGVFIWKEGVLETFSDVEGLIIGRQSDERVFVNADGTVVGVVETGAGTGGQVNPESLFIRTADGQFTIIDNPSLFDDRIRATGINDTGNIIGWYWDHWEDRRIRAAVHFFWDGTMQKITENIVDLASGTGIAYPYDLSNANEVIGLDIYRWTYWWRNPGGNSPPLLNNLGPRGLFPRINRRTEFLTELSFRTHGKWWTYEEMIPYQTLQNGDEITGVDVNNISDVLAQFEDGRTGEQSLWILDYIRDPVEVNLTVTPLEAFLEDTITLTLTVQSGSEETLTEVFPVDLLPYAEGNAELELLTGPVPATPVSLGPFNRQTFVYTFKGAKSGYVKFTSRAQGTKGDGSVVQSIYTTSKTVEIRDRPLSLDIEAKPLVDGKPIQYMEIKENQVVDEDGNPVTPKVEVIITNNAPEDVEVTLQSITPFARDKSPVSGRVQVDDTSVGPGLAPGPLPYTLPDLIPGRGQTTVEYPLKIADDGRFEFEAIATGVYPNAGRPQFQASARGAAVAVGEPFPLEVELEFSDQLHQIVKYGNGAHLIPPGERVKVIGTVRNRTTSYTIQFNGIDAESFRNAKGGILTTFEGGSSPETQAGQGNILPPFPIDHELKPGESKVLTTTILTDSNGAASGTVTWKLPVNGILVDDATGEETDLTAEDILFISDIGGLDGDPMAIALIQDNSKPPLPPLAWWEPAAHYYEGVMYGIGHWTYSTFDTMGALARGAGTASNYLDSTEDLINLLGQEGLAIWHLGEYLHHTWQELSEEEIEAFLLDVSREVQRRTLLSSTQLVGLAKADLQDLNKVLAYVREQTLPLFSNVENAYVSDDPRQIADLWGQISGNVVAEVASAFIPNPKFTRYANSAELRKLASSADNIRLPGGSQEQMLRRMKSGPVTDEAARWGWGAAGAKFEKAIEIMKDFGIRGYARERAPKSVFLIENGEAIAKAEAIKAKGMNELDFWLINDPEKKLRLRGNPGGNDNLNLDAVTVLFRPPEDEVILGWMADQDPRLIDAVLERAKARRKEYDKYRADFETFRETGVEVDFNYRDNDAVPPNPDDPPGFKRGFDYEVVEGENGIEILVPRMTNQDGFLRYISGDIDWVHFSFLDGTPLDPETAGKFYKIMSRCCGLEHGDAFSWIKEGQTVFEGKANQLADYISGLKALLEVSGDGKRAVRIKENLSYISGNNRKNIIYFDNGIKSTALDALQYKARLEANFFKFFEQFRPYRATLLNWSDRFRNVEWEVDKTPDAEILDEDEDGSLRRFNGSAWENTEDPSQVEAKGLSPQITAPFIIAPITNLDTNVEAGSVSMKLVPFNELYAVELAEKINSWFSDGDVIVFDPGNSFQEVRKIVSASPLLLDWPLDHFHSENAIVAVLPENLFEASDRQEQVEVVRIIHNENDKTLRLAIRIPYLSTGFLESGTDMANWMPLTPVAVQGGLSADDQLMVTYPGETLEITINIQNLDTLGRLYLRLRDPGIQ